MNDDQDWDDDPEFDDADEWEFDCGMDRNGQCGLAGSEECDFECPVMAEIHRKEARKRERSRKVTQ